MVVLRTTGRACGPPAGRLLTAEEGVLRTPSAFARGLGFGRQRAPPAVRAPAHGGRCAPERAYARSVFYFLRSKK